MNQSIRKVELVSDGILVEFGDSTRCYYPAKFLLSHIGCESNQVFLDYDPSERQERQLPEILQMHAFGLSTARMDKASD